MAEGRPKSSLRRKLLVILLLAVLAPSIFVSTALILMSIQEQQAEALSALGALEETVSQQALDFIDDLDSFLTGVGRDRVFAERDRPGQILAMNRSLARMSFLRSMSVYNSPREVFAAVSASDQEWEPPRALVQKGFVEAAKGGIFVSSVHYTPASEALALIMSPIGSSGETPVGAVACVVSLRLLQELADGFGSQPDRSVLIVDGTCRAVAFSPSYPDIAVGDSLMHLPPASRLMGDPVSDAAGHLIYRDRWGKRYLAVYRRLPVVGWGVIVEETATPAMTPPYRAVAMALAWMIISVLLVTLLSTYVSRRITRPLRLLREGAEFIGAGNLGHRVAIETGDELQELAASWNHTASRLEASYRELEDEHDKALISAKRADILLRISQALVATLRVDERLELIAASLADVCGTRKVAIWLIEDGLVRPTTSYGLSEEEGEVFAKWETPLEDALDLTKHIVATGQPLAIGNAPEDDLVPTEMAVKFNVRSLLALPMLIEDEVMGVAIAYEPGASRPFSDDQVSMAQAVAVQAAVAVHNAQAYERERHIAYTLQRSFLPQIPRRIGGFEFADRYEAALTESEIGGDFYDLIRLTPSRIGFVIADISGKGLSAAVHTAMIKYMLRAYALDAPTPAELVRRLNRAVWADIGGRMFVTLFYGVLDTDSKELTYVNAGHELPMLMGEDRGLCHPLVTTGTALGIVADYEYGEETAGFEPGDALLLYTDGATDVRNEGRFLGVEGLQTLFCNAAGRTAQEIVDAVEAGIRGHADGELHDDVALMVIKYTRSGD